LRGVARAVSRGSVAPWDRAEAGHSSRDVCDAQLRGADRAHGDPRGCNCGTNCCRIDARLAERTPLNRGLVHAFVRTSVSRLERMAEQRRRYTSALAPAFVVLCLAAGCLPMRPARSSVGAAPPSLAAENVTFPSGSGSTIHAWLIRGRPGGGAVLLFHGVGSN